MKDYYIHYCVVHDAKWSFQYSFYFSIFQPPIDRKKKPYKDVFGSNKQVRTSIFQIIVQLSCFCIREVIPRLPSIHPITVRQALMNLIGLQQAKSFLL